MCIYYTIHRSIFVNITSIKCYNLVVTYIQTELSEIVCKWDIGGSGERYFKFLTEI